MVRRKVQQQFECDDPPCIHVIIDDKRGIFKVFIEDESIAPIPLEKVVAACENIKSVKEKIRAGRLREAVDEEVDMLARKYLRAEPYEREIES